MLVRQIEEYQDGVETRYYVKMEYDKAFLDRMKAQIRWPHRKWDDQKKMWSFSEYGLKCFRNLPGITFYEDALNEVIDMSEFQLSEPHRGIDNSIDYSKFDRPATKIAPPLKLWEFQKEGISRLLHSKTQGLWFECGCGKTYTTICAAKELLDRGEVEQVLVISTVSVALDSWIQTLDRMGYSYEVILGSVAKRASMVAYSDAQFLLTLKTSCQDKPTNLYKTKEDYLNPKIKQTNGKKTDFVTECRKKNLCLVVDELHKLSSVTSTTFKSIMKIAKSCQYRYALTGTVMKSSPEKTLLPLRFLYPSEFSNKANFENAFTIREQGRFGFTIVGYRNLDVLKSILFKAGMPALKVDYLNDLPDLMPPKKIVCETDDCSIKLIEEIRNSDEFKNATGYTDKKDLYIRVHQALVCPSTFGPNFKAENRLQAVVDCLDALSGKTVIFTTLKKAILELYAYLTKAGIECTCCSGDQSFEEIQKRTDKFVNDDNCTVMLATIQKMGTGFDGLKIAQNAIIYDHNTNGADLRQAIGRLWRAGQKNVVSVIHITQDNVVSEAQYERVMLQDKLMGEVEDTHKREIESAVDFREILELLSGSKQFLRRRK